MKRILCLLGLWLATTAPGWSAGLIIIHEADFWRHPPIVPWPPHPPPHPPIPPPRPWIPPQPPVWAPLEVAFTQARTTIKDQIATTHIEQEFYNPNPRQLEGTFLFPVPKGAHINKFTMEINGKPVEAELMAADKARGIYEDIVRRLKDPALLEYSGRDLFKVRIFPIEPHAKKRITLDYAQVLKADGGLLSYVLPLNTEKFSAKPLKNVSVKVELQSKRALKSIYSPSHKVEIKRDGEHKAVIGFEGSDVKPDADFQLLFTQEEGEFGLNLLTYKTGGDDGYFMLLVSPGAEVKNAKILPKDVAFVLDTSGSMAGAKLAQAKKALLFCVENLNDHDRFEIVRFSTEVEPLFDKLVDATKENRSRAGKFIQDLKPIGGTAIEEALRKALANRPDRADRPYLVIFLTDGRPTIGNTDENQIVDGVSKGNKANTRIFCFGIGTDVNTHLLDRITEETKAFSQYVLPEEDIEVKVSSFFTKVKEPVLAGLKLTFPSDIRATKFYPSPLPDLFKGEQLIVAGRYSGQGAGKIEIEGGMAGEVKRFAYDTKFPAESADHDFIPRLWATRRVGFLLDEIRLRGENKELKDEVTELARKYGIVTPYTAYLIIEDEGRRGVPVAARSFRQLEENDQVRRDSATVYNQFRMEKAGAPAVAAAKSFQRLRMAESAAEGIINGNADAFYAAPQAAPPSILGAYGYGGGRGGGGGGSLGRDWDARSRETAGREYAQQGRYVNGRTFFQNGAQWVEAEVQKQTNARKVRVQFDSAEYYDLLKQHPYALAWLALGRNVQFVLDGTVYEVYE